MQKLLTETEVYIDYNWYKCVEGPDGRKYVNLTKFDILVSSDSRIPEEERILYRSGHYAYVQNGEIVGLLSETEGVYLIVENSVYREVRRQENIKGVKNEQKRRDLYDGFAEMYIIELSPPR